jgi:hypothetical protein
VKDVFGRTTLSSLSLRHRSFAEHQAQQGGTGPKHPDSPSKARKSPIPARKATPRAAKLSH